MHTVELKATHRQSSGKGHSRRLRQEGRIPTVAYGRNEDAQPLAMSQSAVEAIILSDRGRNTIINLVVEGGAEQPVMIKDYTVHPLTRRLLHADFIRIDPSKAVEVEVPFLIVGKAKGEVAGGTVLRALRSVKLRCLPGAIPDSLEYDVSALEIDAVVKVSEVPVPEGITVLHPPDQKVLSIKPPRVETAGEDGAEGEAAAAPAAEGAAAAEAS